MKAGLIKLKDKVVAELKNRTKKSAKRYAETCRFVPAGVMSRGRQIEPYPFFVDHAKGSRLWDIDG
ncbi:MAG: aspartate aminotransferase family protein, partial [Planctomycetota bacterium]